MFYICTCNFNFLCIWTVVCNKGFIYITTVLNIFLPIFGITSSLLPILHKYAANNPQSHAHCFLKLGIFNYYTMTLFFGSSDQ